MAIQDRQTQLVDLDKHDLDSFQTAARSIPFQDLAIRYNRIRRYDVGSLCYTERFHAPRKKSRPVTKQSLRTERIDRLQNWALEIASEHYISATGATCYTNTVNFVKFADWCDLSSQSDFLLSPEHYHRALVIYSIEIQNSNRMGNKSDFTSQRDLAAAIKAAPLLFPGADYDFRKDLAIVSSPAKKNTPTPPPPEEEVAAYLSTCSYIFHGLTDFLLEGKSFPSRLELGSDQPWLMLAEYPFATDRILAINKKIANNVFWDYSTGELRSLEACRALSLCNDSQLKGALRAHRELMTAANIDLRHPMRLRLAKFAHDAFLALFVANAGSNDQPTEDIPWDEKYESKPSTKSGYKVIKFRGLNREVTFDIQPTFEKELKKYKELRNYICKDTNHPYLFVGMMVKNEKEIMKLRPNELANFNTRLKSYYDKNFKGYSFRALRSYKANFYNTRGIPANITARALSNSESTLHKHYTTPNETNAIGEVVELLNRLMQLLDDYAHDDSPSGGCDAPGLPQQAIIPPDGYEPDCKKLEGCLFCEHFRLHANEQDIRKLLSMRFVINERIHKCQNAEQFKMVHQPAIDHIDLLLEALKEARPEVKSTIQVIATDITQHYQLTDYWERQLSRLHNLGLV
ncbi:hypothetical protein [Pseudomonas sp. NPDC089547]|uniref:hypothetical protein n=1 Tax=Pseudomonas sp. NPDC089547 TaxID=3390652 RepID=UPI003D07D71B